MKQREKMDCDGWLVGGDSYANVCAVCLVGGESESVSSHSQVCHLGRLGP